MLRTKAPNYNTLQKEANDKFFITCLCLEIENL